MPDLRMLGISAILLILLLFFTDVLGSKRTILTYNTALYDGIGFGHIDPATVVPTRDERRNAIIEQLKKTRADVVCLNEVYLAEDVNKISKELESIYRYSFSPVHDKNGQVPAEGLDTEPPCPLATFGPLGACLETHGCILGSSVAEALECVVSNCKTELLAVSQECWACFVTSVEQNNPTAPIGSCTDIQPGPYRNINPSGLMLLSRRPWRDLEYTDFHPGTREIFVRGYLEAKVLGIGRVVCAHLTNHGAGTYYEVELEDAGITSWAEQGQVEVNALVNAFKRVRRLFLAGDFNVDPGPPYGVTPIQPELFKTLAKTFCVDVIGQCTYCNSTENVYNGNVEPEMVDYIFFNGYIPLRKKRVFDDVTNGSGFPLSDHFGVMQRFKRRRSRYRH